jgi:hypothetical protein
MVRNRLKWRLVTALQTVNEYTVLNGPSLRDNLVRDAQAAAQVHQGKTCFSGIDALEGFTVIKNDAFTAKICSLATRWGTYLADRMLFGSTFAPEVFHSALARIIAAARGDDVSSSHLAVSQFIDDMLQSIDPTDPVAWGEHIDFWDRLLTLLYEAGFRLKLPKCKWLQREGEFCGYILTGTIARVDLSRYEDLDKMAPPPKPSDLARAIGFFNYFADNIPA